jgi:hypothetical protein
MDNEAILGFLSKKPKPKQKQAYIWPHIIIAAPSVLFWAVVFINTLILAHNADWRTGKKHYVDKDKEKLKKTLSFASNEDLFAFLSTAYVLHNKTLLVPSELKDSHFKLVAMKYTPEQLVAITLPGHREHGHGISMSDLAGFWVWFPMHFFYVLVALKLTSLQLSGAVTAEQQLIRDAVRKRAQPVDVEMEAMPLSRGGDGIEAGEPENEEENFTHVVAQSASDQRFLSGVLLSWITPLALSLKWCLDSEDRVSYKFCCTGLLLYCLYFMSVGVRKQNYFMRTQKEIDEEIEQNLADEMANNDK